MAEKFSPQTEQQQQSVMELEQTRGVAAELGSVACEYLSPEGMLARRNQLKAETARELSTLPAEVKDLYSVDFTIPREETLVGRFY